MPRNRQPYRPVAKAAPPLDRRRFYRVRHTAEPGHELTGTPLTADGAEWALWAPLELSDRNPWMNFTLRAQTPRVGKRVFGLGYRRLPDPLSEDQNTSALSLSRDYARLSELDGELRLWAVRSMARAVAVENAREPDVPRALARVDRTKAARRLAWLAYAEETAARRDALRAFDEAHAGTFHGNPDVKLRKARLMNAYYAATAPAWGRYIAALRAAGVEDVADRARGRQLDERYWRERQAKLEAKSNAQAQGS